MRKPTGDYPARAVILMLALVLVASSLPVTRSLFPAPPSPMPSAWQAADLRAVDGAQQVPPGVDLIAAYTRSAGDEFQLRLDFLDVVSGQEADLYLVFDLASGGTNDLPGVAQATIEWELLLVVQVDPSTGHPPVSPAAVQVYRSSGESYTQIAAQELRARVVRDPAYDTITISFNQAALNMAPNRARIEAISLPAGSSMPADRLVFEAGQQPPKPLPLLLTFSSAFSGDTPTLALRRWNGAHTGPAGGRHGLFYLLRGARNAQVPVLLLDLKTPGALAGLEATGGLGLVQDLQRKGLLLLAEPLPATPFPLPDWAVAEILSRARRVGRAFGLADTALVFAPSGVLQAGSGEVIGAWSGRPVLHLPAYPQTQAMSGEVLSLDLRRELATAAATIQAEHGETPVHVLQWVLPASAWGEPAAARQAFAYLKAHPWIQFPRAPDLLPGTPLRRTARSVVEMPVTLEGEAVFQKVLGGLRRAPENSLSGLAWDSFMAVWSPIYPAPARLSELRLGVMSDLHVLLAAAAWGEIASACPPGGILLQPAGINNPKAPLTHPCSLPEELVIDCPLLLGARSMAAFNPQDGALSHLFTLDSSGAAHQLVGPSSQLTVGLGEALFWREQNGRLSDPAMLPGFSYTRSFQNPTLTFDSSELAFTTGSEDQRERLVYQMEAQLFHIRLETVRPGQAQLNVLADPQTRLAPGAWQAYALDLQAGRLKAAWQVTTATSPGLRLVIHSNLPLQVNPFTASRRLMLEAEQPNLEYPAGHALPVPFAQVETNHAGLLTWTIELGSP